MTDRIRKLRRAAGLSQTQACVLAGVSPVTWRIFECNPEGISQEKRQACESAMEKIAKQAKERAA